jgi:hypothetical protein
MGRILRNFGLTILAVTAWLLIAEEAEWVTNAYLNMSIPMLAGAGAVSLGLGLLLSLFTPVRQKLRRGRCARCGAKIERGQSYCLDHLRETVNEYQDHARRADAYRPGGRV